MIVAFLFIMSNRDRTQHPFTMILRSSKEDTREKAHLHRASNGSRSDCSNRPDNNHGSTSTSLLHLLHSLRLRLRYNNDCYFQQAKNTPIQGLYRGTPAMPHTSLSTL